MSDQQDTQATELRDAVYNAFMALWRGAEGDQALLAYLAAQARYEASLAARENDADETSVIAGEARHAAHRAAALP